jgi:hypothetical protein
MQSAPPGALSPHEKREKVSLPHNKPADDSVIELIINK